MYAWHLRHNRKQGTQRCKDITNTCLPSPTGVLNPIGEVNFSMVPNWLQILAYAWLTLSSISFVIVLIDVPRQNLSMSIMKAVWPLTTLYMGPIGLYAYRTWVRTPTLHSAHPDHQGGHVDMHHMMDHSPVRFGKACSSPHPLRCRLRIRRHNWRGASFHVALCNRWIEPIDVIRCGFRTGLRHRNRISILFNRSHARTFTG